MTLEQIVATGNKTPWFEDEEVEEWEARRKTLPTNKIQCADGFTLSVIAGAGTYCIPRPDWPFGENTPEDYPGPYTHVEVGFPSERPEPWAVWEEYVESPESPTGTVYAFVPAEVVRDLIQLHGGEVDA